MNQSIKYINLLEGFKSYIKSCHWSACNMSEHKLCDDISKTISDNEDEIAEIAQGIDGKFSITDLKPKRMKFESTKDLLEKLLKETKLYYSTIKGRKYTGLRSVVENFIGEINKYTYLLKLVLKEDLKRRIKSNLNESTKSKRKTIFINENQMMKLRLINEMFEPSMLWLGNYIEQNYKTANGEPISNAEDLARELLNKYHPKSKRDVDEILHYPQHYPLSYEVMPI